MKTIVTVFLLLLASTSTRAQDTFSLVAVDSNTREIVSIGASCIDGNVIPGGAKVISSLIPNVGALHTQSFYFEDNKVFGEQLLNLGLSAKRTVDSLVARDVSYPFRQYIGVTLYPSLSVAVFTGNSCYEWAGHWKGDHVAIAGNILLDSNVVINMKNAWLSNADLRLPDRAMAALKAVNYPGADRRCLAAGLSSRSAFLRLAHPKDDLNELTLDLSVEFLEGERDPIDLLEETYLAWKQANPTE